MATRHTVLGAAHPLQEPSLRPARPTLSGLASLDAPDLAATPSEYPVLSGADAASAIPPPSSPPKAERLPSFRHISKIADAAAAQDDEIIRSMPYPGPSPSTGPAANFPVTSSRVAISPITLHKPYPQPPQMSTPSTTPALHFPPQPVTAPMPAESLVSLPQTTPTFVYPFNPRREAEPHLHYSGPPSLRTMPTSSSSGESYSHHSSLGDISTSHTSPTEYTGPVDVHGRPKFPVPTATGQEVPQPTQHPIQLSRASLLLPTPHTQTLAAVGPWICEHPGCGAAPFPTQYLLNSHSTSHSPHRPHYCPVPGCPRGVGGRGFKRKNEMIRHGLTHNTPGYVCPFCPDRSGHRYPRPDNLQRHVRVHHVDKDPHDPVLREVLSQRAGGSGNSSNPMGTPATAGPAPGETRRRRATASAGSTPRNGPSPQISLDRSGSN